MAAAAPLAGCQRRRRVRRVVLLIPASLRDGEPGAATGTASASAMADFESRSTGTRTVGALTRRWLPRRRIAGGSCFTVVGASGPGGPGLKLASIGRACAVRVTGPGISNGTVSLPVPVPARPGRSVSLPARTFKSSQLELRVTGSLAVPAPSGFPP